MEIIKLKVKYKELSSNGSVKVMSDEFKSWDEEGSYTLFYDDVSLDSLSLIVPTSNIIKIEVIR